VLLVANIIAVNTIAIVIVIAISADFITYLKLHHQ